MATTTAALLGALVGAITGLVSATITNFVALRNEQSRQEEARRASYVQALREHTGTAFAELFVVQHAINWITWFAKNDPRVLNNEKIASYDAEVHGPMAGRRRGTARRPGKPVMARIPSSATTRVASGPVRRQTQRRGVGGTSTM